MVLLIKENLQEMNKKYPFEIENPKKLALKVGKISLFHLIDVKKPYSIKLLSISKSKIPIFTSFLEKLYSFQIQNSQRNSLVKLKEVYHEPNSNEFYLIQKKYYRNLSEKLEEMKEIELLSLIREIIRFYYNLKDYNEFLKLLVNPKIGIKALTLKNIVYDKKSNNKFEKMRFKIDLLDFLAKDHEDLQDKCEDFHLKSFEKLILRIFLGKKERGEEFGKENKKKWGFCSDSLINRTILEGKKLKWDDYFNNPLLRVDISMEFNYEMQKKWKINKTLDKKKISDRKGKKEEIDEDFEKNVKQKIMPKEKNEILLKEDGSQTVKASLKKKIVYHLKDKEEDEQEQEQEQEQEKTPRIKVAIKIKKKKVVSIDNDLEKTIKHQSTKKMENEENKKKNEEKKIKSPMVKVKLPSIDSSCEMID